MTDVGDYFHLGCQHSYSFFSSLYVKLVWCIARLDFTVMHVNLTCLLSKLQSSNLEIFSCCIRSKTKLNRPRGQDPFWYCFSEILEIIWIYMSQVNYRTNLVAVQANSIKQCGDTDPWNSSIILLGGHNLTHL